MLDPGQTFEGYVVDGQLGTGGYANVYRVHPRSGASEATGDRSGASEAMALKILRDDLRGPREVARLHREFDVAKAVEHPHVVSVYRNGPGWLTMQLVDGGTVSTLATMADRLEALAQIADALDFVHRQGFVHSDVKPTNILVFRDFTARGAVLIDFGVAHSVAADAGRRPTHVQGSLPYAAPELLHGRAPTGATDEYALACTAVELITGKRPFTAATPMALVDAQLNKPPPKWARRVAWVTHAFDSILAKALAKDPDARYQSCTEFVQLITHALGDTESQRRDG
ncbi:MAG: serine/threonine-protein kinase [Mycobacterium sp.]